MPEVTRRGGPIQYEIIECASPWRADPQTIVFHHGVGACGATWSGWTSTLVDDYRLLRFDMRGHGDTPLPTGFDWSLQGMLDDLGAVIEAAAVKRVHLVGESIGGTAVLAFAAAYPERVATVTVCNGAHVGGSIANVDGWADLIARDGMAAWSAHMMQCRFNAGALSAAMWQWYEHQQARCDPTAIIDALGVLTAVDLTAQLGDMLPPVLLMHPDDSPFIPVETMLDLKRRLRRATIKVFPGCRHGLPYSNAHECACSTQEFLAAHAELAS